MGGVFFFFTMLGTIVVIQAIASLVLFQFMLPHRERLDSPMLLEKVVLFQPTLPHRERQIAHNHLSQAVDVSTHAPAQGATAKGYKIHPFILYKTEKNLPVHFFKTLFARKIIEVSSA